MGFITAILQSVGVVGSIFNSLDSITKAIANERLALIAAKTDQERQASAERIAMLTARQAVLVAESGTRAGLINAWLRALTAIGPISILIKLSLWDKVVGSFVGCSGTTVQGTCGAFITDPIDDHIWYGVMSTIAFYLVADAWSGRK